MTTQFLLQTRDVDDAVRGYILKKIAKLEKLADVASKVEIEVDKNKQGKYRVEVMIRAPRHLYRAEETSESIQGSIDLVVEKLLHEIMQNKEKQLTMKRRGARSIKKKAVLDHVARF